MRSLCHTHGVPSLLAILFWLLAACGGTATPTATPAAAPTEVATRRPTPSAAPTEAAAPTSRPATTAAASTPTAPPLPTLDASSQDSGAASRQPTPPPDILFAGAPVRLQIPAIGVDAAVERVGKTESGAMGVPERVENVAWYELGATPGELGSVVISGHLDDYRGDPAVFWALNTLQPGDEITLHDGQGNTVRYEVTGTEIYPFDQAPIDRIFLSKFEGKLSLITCNGTWDKNARNYDKRLVVYSRLLP